ncbi:MAG: hypothetical protein ACRDJO_08425 [Actinomycetota bacterium]
MQLGIQVEAFLSSPVGKYIAGRAEEESQMALSLLGSVDPEDAKRIRELQNQHWRGSTVIEWLVEAIRVGAHAEAELTAD